MGTWGGWVFVNMDPLAEPLLEYLDPIPSRLEGFKLEDMRIAWYKSVVLPANWKTAIDAFIESWHVPGTHPQLLRVTSAPHRRPSPSPRTTASTSTSSSATTRAMRISHGSAPTGTPTLRPGSAADPGITFATVEYSLRELRALNLATDLLAAAELRAAADGDDGTARAAVRRLRAKHARAAGIDYPDVTAEQLRGPCTTGTSSPTRSS